MTTGFRYRKTASGFYVRFQENQKTKRLRQPTLNGLLNTTKGNEKTGLTNRSTLFSLARKNVI
jgi:hypothetical protein